MDSSRAQARRGGCSSGKGVHGRLGARTRSANQASAIASGRPRQSAGTGVPLVQRGN